MALLVPQPSNMYTALVDADIVVYRAAYVSEGSSLQEGISSATTQLDQICTDLDIDHTKLRLFFSGNDNFRKRINPEYKANRLGKPKPTHFSGIRKYLEDYYDCASVSHLEADDLLSVAMFEDSDSVCCSIDKDLLQIEGKHYNLKSRILRNVRGDEAIFNLYRQLLMGDSVDNIPGIPGIGPKKADKILENLQLDTVDDLLAQNYIDKFGDIGVNKLCETFNMVNLQVYDDLIQLAVPTETSWTTESLSVEEFYSATMEA